MYYDDEFFDEPSEFEQGIESLKETLAQSIKEGHQRELELLRIENASLQDVKRNFEAVKREYEQKAHALEHERQNMRNAVRRERLDSLMDGFQIIMFKAYSRRERGKKCTECDESRRRHYTTPLGKLASEECICAASKTVYDPKEYICTEFKINRDGNKFSAFYKIKDSEVALYDNSVHSDNIFKAGTAYENLSSYSALFETIEECQKYCDYLNLPKAIEPTEIPSEA